MNYFRRTSMLLRILFSGVLTTTMTLACTDVNDMLGDNLIPENQDMVIKIDTLYNINTYLAQTDSIPTSNMGVGIIGSQSSPVFGTTQAGVLMHYVPYTFKHKDYYGYRAVADSIKLSLAISSYSKGNAETEQTFYIYKVKEDMELDSLYYPTIAIENVVDFDNPIFSFTHKGKHTGMSTKTLTSIGSAGTDFMNSLVDADTALYKSGADTSFRKAFKGLYIRPAASSNADANIFAFDLTKNATNLILYAHNGYKDSLETVVKDTIDQGYSLDDVAGKYNANLSINTIKHNYTGSRINPAAINDTLPNSPTQSTVYVQCLEGVTTYLRFTDEFINSIKNKVTAEYRNISINKAMMIIAVDDYSVTSLDAAPLRFGLYYNYKGLNPRPTPDYNYSYEQEGSEIPFGGYLNRSRGFYSMDITVYVQRLLIKPETPKQINLAPSMELTPLGFGNVALKGTGSDKPIKIVLTYTLIK